jgi:hypothetical protein
MAGGRELLGSNERDVINGLLKREKYSVLSFCRIGYFLIIPATCSSCFPQDQRAQGELFIYNV